MKWLIVLLLLVLIIVSVTPSQTSDESYYLYPTVNPIGASIDLPAGEMVEWAITCTVFFKGVKMQDMASSSGIVIDKDKYTSQSFTLSEMQDVHITYTVRAFIRLSTVYLWNGELYVDGQPIKKMPYGEDSWAQYKCFDVSGCWSIGFYAVTSGNIQTPDNEILMAFLLFFGLCFAIMIEKGLRWISKWRKEEEGKRFEALEGRL